MATAVLWFGRFGGRNTVLSQSDRSIVLSVGALFCRQEHGFVDRINAMSTGACLLSTGACPQEYCGVDRSIVLSTGACLGPGACLGSLSGRAGGLLAAWGPVGGLGDLSGQLGWPVEPVWAVWQSKNLGRCGRIVFPLRRAPKSPEEPQEPRRAPKSPEELQEPQDDPNAPRPGTEI